MGKGTSFYRDQLTFRVKGGRAMAKAHPREADTLAKRGTDPDVERILEGLAYLSGKITEKQVQSLPELSQFLFDILFPNYLCPVPAAAVVQLANSQWPDVLPRGSEIQSVPVEGTPCRFRTIYDAEVGPLKIRDVAWDLTGTGANLTLQFSGASALAKSTTVVQDHIRMHLHGEPLVTTSLYYWLQTKLHEVEVVDSDGGIICQGQGKIRIQPLGLTDAERMLPYPSGCFAGFRLIQEYFTLSQKFLFFDIEGIWSLLDGVVPPGDTFGIRFRLKLESAGKLMVDRRHFRLGCTPVINLFDHSADPIEYSPAKADYPVRPAGPDRHYFVYRVKDVTGVASTGARTHYPLISDLELDVSASCSQVHRRRYRDEDQFTYISLTEGSGRATVDHRLLLIDLYCSNGDLPLALRVGDINKLPAPYDHISCQNITAVTPPAPVPTGEELRQRLISHLALTQLDLATLKGMHETVDLYNLHALIDEQAAWAHNLILEGLTKVESREVQDRHHGIPIRGRATVLDVGESAFASEGELYLFGCVVNEFIALQTPLNWFSEFEINWAKTKSRYLWPRRLGTGLLKS